MKIYLAGSISGGRDFANSLNLICNLLEKRGHEVLTKKIVVNLDPKDIGAKTRKDRKQIVNRDMTMIKKSDAVIVEASQWGYGIGYEHRVAEEFKKPVLILRSDSLKNNRLSAFMDGTGYKKLHFAFYNEDTVERILNNFLKNVSKPPLHGGKYFD